MQKEKYTKIVCFGEVLWDMLPSGAKPGGAPLNVAIHLKRFGNNPILISKIGSDSNGEKLIQFLNNSAIETKYIQTDKKLPTSEVLVHIDNNKNATYEICEPVAWDNIQFNKKIEMAANEADLIIFGSLASRNITTLETLKKLIQNSTAKTLIDVNLRPPFDKKEHVEQLIHWSDFAKLNDDELIKIAGWNNKTGNIKELIHWFSSFYNCPLLCVTRGENGAVLFIENKLYEHPGYKIETEDTVGAGDSFLASLVANLSKINLPEDALKHACATGAYVASHEGAVPDYSEKDIQYIINSTP